ncbi:MAG TPA: SDR family oxidoreductase [Tepidisphaeraceae bacterium]|nr:SDR family oxidoreductase [Tepidisphaeraceae bacterium]
MTQLLQHQIAIVTGGNRGIGLAMVRQFVEQGARVITCALENDFSSLADLKDNISFIQLDMASPDSGQSLIAHAISKFGPPTIIVNNAAQVTFRNTADATVEEIEQTLRVNVIGYWSLAKAALPSMKSAGRGAIINVASTHPYQTRPNCFPYSMSKGAVLAMTRAMAVDFGPAGIRVNALLPGIVDTQVTRQWLQSQSDPEKSWADVLTSHSLPRLPTVEELASAALFLASDLSSGITGAELVVDCGRQVKRP